MAASSVIAMAMLYDSEFVVRAYYGTDSRVHQPLIGAFLAFAITQPLAEQVSSPGRSSHAHARCCGTPRTTHIGGGVHRRRDRLLHGRKPRRRPAHRSPDSGHGKWPDILALPRSGLEPITPQLGRISYGFYLWHWPIILWLAMPVGLGFWERRAVNLAQFGLTLAVAVASFWLIENPIPRTPGLDRKAQAHGNHLRWNRDSHRGRILLVLGPPT